VRDAPVEDDLRDRLVVGLSPGNVIQANSGGFVANSGDASLNGTTAGNTVLLFALSQALQIATPTGFAPPDLSVGAAPVFVFRRPNVPAGETTWSLGTGSPVAVTWVALEVSGLDPDSPLATSASNTATGSTFTLSTGTTSSFEVPGTMCFAMHGFFGSLGTPPTWGDHTNGYVELREQGVNNGAAALSLAVAAAFPGTPGAQECTATASASSTDAQLTAAVLVYTQPDVLDPRAAGILQVG
jgi:hypothetical protein